MGNEVSVDRTKYETAAVEVRYHQILKGLRASGMPQEDTLAHSHGGVDVGS